MSTLTTYYSLIKPSGAVGGDFVDVTQLNTNSDLIDAALHTHDGRLTTLESLPGASPAFVSLSRTTVLSVPNGAPTTVAWTLETEDTFGFHAASATQLVVPAGKAGVYQINATVAFAPSGNGSQRFANILNNGVLVDVDNRENTAALDVTLKMSATIRLIVGDVITVVMGHNHVAALNTSATIPLTIQMCKVSA